MPLETLQESTTLTTDRTYDPIDTESLLFQPAINLPNGANAHINEQDTNGLDQQPQEQTSAEISTSSMLKTEVREPNELSPEEMFILYQETKLTLLQNDMRHVALGKLRSFFSHITSTTKDTHFFKNGTAKSRAEHIMKLGVRAAWTYGLITVSKYVFSHEPITNIDATIAYLGQYTRYGITMFSSMVGASAGFGKHIMMFRSSTKEADASLLGKDRNSLDFYKLNPNYWDTSSEGLIRLAHQARVIEEGTTTAIFTDPYREKTLQDAKGVSLSRTELLKEHYQREAVLLHIAQQSADPKLQRKIIMILTGGTDIYNYTQPVSPQEHKPSDDDLREEISRKATIDITKDYHRSAVLQALYNIGTAFLAYGITSEIVKGASNLYNHIHVDASKMPDLHQHTYEDVIQNSTNKGNSASKTLGIILTDHVVPIATSTHNLNTFFPDTSLAIQRLMQTLNTTSADAVKNINKLKTLAAYLSETQAKKDDEIANTVLESVKKQKLTSLTALNRIVSATVKLYYGNNVDIENISRQSPAVRNALKQASQIIATNSADHSHATTHIVTHSVARVTNHVVSQAPSHVENVINLHSTYKEPLKINISSLGLESSYSSMGYDLQDKYSWSSLVALSKQHPDLFLNPPSGMNFNEIVSKYGVHISSLYDLQKTNPSLYNRTINALGYISGKNPTLSIDVKVQVPTTGVVKLFGGNGLFSTLGNMGVDPLGKSGRDITMALYKQQLLHPNDLKYRIFTSPDISSFMKTYGNHIHSFGEIDPNKDPKGYNLMIKSLSSVNAGNFRYMLSQPHQIAPAAHKVVTVMTPGIDTTPKRPIPIASKPSIVPTREAVHSTTNTSPARHIPKKTTPKIKPTSTPIKAKTLKLPVTPHAIDNGYVDLGNSTNPELKQQAYQIWDEVIGNATKTHPQSADSIQKVASLNLRLFIPGAHDTNFQLLGPSDTPTDKANLINRVSGNLPITNPDGKVINSYITPLKMEDAFDPQVYGPHTQAYGYVTDNNSKVLVVSSHSGFAMEYIDKSTYSDAFANFIRDFNFIKQGSHLELLADIKDSSGHISTYSIEYEVMVNVKNQGLKLAAGQTQPNWFDYGNLAKLNGAKYYLQNPLVLVGCQGYDFNQAISGQPDKGIQYVIAIPYRILKVTDKKDFIHTEELSAA